MYDQLLVASDPKAAKVREREKVRERANLWTPMERPEAGMTADLQRGFSLGIPAKFTYRDPLSSVFPNWQDPASGDYSAASAAFTNASSRPHRDPGPVGYYPEFRRLYVEALAQADDEGELVVHTPGNIELVDGNFASADEGVASLNFKQLTILISYRLANATAGIYFSLPDPIAAPHRFPYVYTHNQACSTRLWVPCVDTMWDKAPWRLEFVVPRQLARLVSSNERRGFASSDGDFEFWETVVAASGELLEQVAHPTDPRLKVVVYELAEPVPASSIMFAAGAFDIVRMRGWHSVGREEVNLRLEDNGRGKVPGGVDNDNRNGDDMEVGERERIFDGCGGYVYSPPGRRKQVLQTTDFLCQALDFYVDAYITSKFPFPAYRIVFLEDTYNPVATGAGISVLSSHLLVDDHVIDQVYETRKLMARALAQQWFGNYIVPNSWLDIWIQIGLANYISGLFLKKMFGTNEYRFRIRKDMERLAELDIRQPPLAPTRQKMVEGTADNTTQQQKGKEAVRETIDPLLHVHYHPDDDWSSSRSEFLNTKAPLVLYMLDRRMGKGVFQKVLDHIIMNVRTQDMPEGLKTAHFHLLCRKMSGRVEVEGFFKQWVYGAGTPRLSFLPKFNQRKMVIEVLVKQINPSFLAGTPGAVEKFTGPVTVRVHEPLGIFDTDISMNGDIRLHEIVYHSKYKRIKRGGPKRPTIRSGGVDDMDVVGDDAEAPEKDGDDDDEEKSHYEWIRVDPENDWICLKKVGLHETNWVLQLQKDRDVLAQYEAILAIRAERYQTCLSILSDIVHDRNYYYRVREEAAYGLSELTEYIRSPSGVDLLMQAYRKMYCIASTGGAVEPFVVPLRNKFDDFAEYFVQKALIAAISSARLADGSAPTKAKQFLLGILHHNDNTGNKFSDAELVSALCRANGDIFIAPHDRSNREERELFEQAVSEIEYLLNVDRVLPSYHNVVTSACLETVSKWMLKGRKPISLTTFLEYSRYGNFQTARMIALDAIILLDGLLAPGVSEYLMAIIEGDPAPYVRYHVARSLLNWSATLFEVSSLGIGLVPTSPIVPSIQKTEGALTEHSEDFTISGGVSEVLESPQQTEELVENMKRSLGPTVWRFLNDTSNTDERIRRIVLKLCEYAFEPTIDVSPVVAPKIKAKLKMGGTSRTQRSGGPVRYEFLAVGTSVVQRLRTHPSSFLFRNPVVFPGYHDVIKHPMDLSTVSNKLINGLYANDLSLLVSDIFLIFQNCYIFNDPKIPVSRSARVLHHFFLFDVLPDAQRALGIPAAHVHTLAVPMSPTRESRDSQDQGTGAVQLQQESANQPLSLPDLNFCRSLLDHVKSQAAAAIFQNPVDPVRSNIPSYPTIVQHPMDLSTLASNLEQGRYINVEAFAVGASSSFYLWVSRPLLSCRTLLNSIDLAEADMRLIFSNAVLFNGPSHVIAISAENLRSIFEKDLVDPLFRAKSSVHAIVRPTGPTGSTLSVAVGQPLVRTPLEFSQDERIARFSQLLGEKDGSSDSVDVESVDRLICHFSSRPTFPDARMTKISTEHEACTKIMNSLGKSKSADPFRQPVDPTVFPLYAEVIKEWANQGLTAWVEGAGQQLDENMFDNEELNQMHRVLLAMEKSTLADPFRFPVDPIRQGVPNYFKTIKHPMDLSTIRKNLERRFYTTPQHFVDDVELMFSNCFTFNKPRTLTYRTGQSLYHDVFVIAFGYTSLNATLNLVNKYGQSDGLPREIRDSLRDILIKFMQEVDARYFVGAVDHTQYPEYRSVVAQPIDLGTMKFKLDVNAYEAVEDLEKDIGLMFDNSYRFNTGRFPQVVTATDNLNNIYRNKYRKEIHAVRHELAATQASPVHVQPSVVTTSQGAPKRALKVKLQRTRPRRELSASTSEVLKRIVLEIMADPNSVYFVGAVNLNEYPDYLDINPVRMKFLCSLR
ncbi:hypothetical protein HDU93_002983 [Gonapodya sp. JEL0774]|nr:hypothetical protein HDU93_002983 [Gonapodya sp. JEL0774]